MEFLCQISFFLSISVKYAVFYNTLLVIKFQPFQICSVLRDIYTCVCFFLITQKKHLKNVMIIIELCLRFLMVFRYPTKKALRHDFGAFMFPRIYFILQIDRKINFINSFKTLKLLKPLNSPPLISCYFKIVPV